MRIFSATLLFLAALGAGNAVAQQNPNQMGTPEQRQFCQEDYFKFCSVHQPGTPELTACFRTNLPKMSPACRAAVEKDSPRNTRR